MALTDNSTPEIAPAAPGDGQPRQLMTKRQVLDTVPLSFVALWDLMRTGGFPLPVRINGRPYWYRHEVEAYLASLPRVRYKPRPADGSLAEPTPDSPSAPHAALAARRHAEGRRVKLKRTRRTRVRLKRRARAAAETDS